MPRAWRKAWGRAVRAWGQEIYCANPEEYSSSLTAVLMPEGTSEIAFRSVVLEHFNLSLGSGLTKLRDKVFRIGHLGDFNDLMLCGTLAGVEMGLELARVPHKKGGVTAAMQYLAAPDKAACIREVYERGLELMGHILHPHLVPDAPGVVHEIEL